MDRGRPAIEGRGEGATERAQDRLRGGKARVEAVAGRDDDVGGVQPGELRSVGVDHSCRQCGHRAGAADDEHVRPLGLLVKSANARHEAARVGKIDVVHTGGDADSRQPVVLALVGARGIDQQGRFHLQEIGAREPSRIHAGGDDAGATLCREPPRRLAGPLQRAPGDDQLECRLPRQPLGNARPERAVGAQHENAAHGRVAELLR